jgi:excisionase family DNA binding protein
MADEERWLTVAQVAERLQVTQRAVGQLIKVGTLPALLVTQREGWRIKASDVDALGTVQEKKGQEEHGNG